MRAWRTQFHWHVTLPPFVRWISTERIPFAKGAWHISSHGRVCNKTGHVSLGCLLQSGYRSIHLAEQNWFVHRVVKLTFHGLPKDPNMWQVHHRDGNKENNRLDNLDFVNNSLNVQHSYADPSRRCGGSKMWKPAEWRPVGSQDWIECPSVTVAAQQFGVTRSSMSKWCKNQAIRKGFQFRFQDIREKSLPGEKWRNIRDPATGMELHGRKVSSLGRVMLQHGFVYRGCKRHKQGYFSTTISNGTYTSKHFVHRLVANTFLGPPPTKHRIFINHKDGDKGNNAAENLEYVTQAENVRHHFTRAGWAPRQPDVKTRAVLSRDYGSDSDWTHHPSMTSAARTLALHIHLVSRCARGLQKQTGGYEFRLADSTIKSIPGEKWLPINLSKLIDEKENRMQKLLYK